METTTTRLIGHRGHNLTGDLAAAFAYWDNCRKDRLAPPWSEFQMVKLPLASIPWCSVVDVVHDPIDFIFRFWGSARTNLQGRDLTGLSVRELRPEEFARMVFLHDAQVVEVKQPIHSVTRFETAHDDPGTCEFLRLPFSDDGETVSAIMALSSYNEAGIRAMHQIFGTKPFRYGF